MLSKEARMEKRNKLQEQYQQYRIKREEEFSRAMKSAMKFIFLVAVPLIVLSIALMVQVSYAMRNFGYVVGIGSLIFFGYMGYRAYEKEMAGYKDGLEWEETLKAYLSDAGVDVQTLAPAYKEGKQYDPEVEHHDTGLVYRGQAEINGATSPLEVRIVAQKIGAYTPNGELIPVS